MTSSARARRSAATCSRPQQARDPCPHEPPACAPPRLAATRSHHPSSARSHDLSSARTNAAASTCRSAIVALASAASTCIASVPTVRVCSSSLRLLSIAHCARLHQGVPAIGSGLLRERQHRAREGQTRRQGAYPSRDLQRCEMQRHGAILLRGQEPPARNTGSSHRSAHSSGAAPPAGNAHLGASHGVDGIDVNLGSE